MISRPLRNRVDPWGRLNAVPDKAALLMGNRGHLHDANQAIAREYPWDGKRWIACCLHYKGGEPRKGRVFGNSYSELFFLDEATAFSAGHRPCRDCQKDRFEEFKAAWRGANPDAVPAASHSIDDIDAFLHGERVSENRGKMTYPAELASLPSGTFVEAEGEAVLLWKGKLRRWSFSGYTVGMDMSAAPTRATVLTPKSIVRMFVAGFLPTVHPSAEQ